jgi:hypothetical protein
VVQEEGGMSFFHGQMVIWYRKNGNGDNRAIQVPATFLSLCGKESAFIRVEGKQYRVKRDNIEAVKEKPVLMRSGCFVSN